MNLKQKYNRQDFLEFLKRFLPDFKEDIRPFKSNNFQLAKEVFFIGQSEELDLQVFEFSHIGSSEARVKLAADGFKAMKERACYQAIAVFQSPKSNDWRLSLMTARPEINEGGEIKQSFSNPRRYSFFLGPEARTHTPEEFLIKKGRVKDLQDLISRFDVEIVTKVFFAQYKKLFDDLQKFLVNDRAFLSFSKKNSIDIDSFAKKILGQIVFCYFLQKKGWLGAPKTEAINKGDKDFMRSLFINCERNSNSYYNDCLEPLFYDALNKAPEEKDDFFRSYFGCQVPFLNGGLFEPIENYEWEKSFLHIPDKIFSNKEKTGVLDIFDLYNFTVYEDDPVDREVSVDPEMLGKVFENLLPENLRKGQGTYYTPREIVHYMCQESLISYLVSETNIDEKNIRKLITSKEHLFTNDGGFTFSSRETEKLDKALANIKVCDPACGSGAFLVGILHEIVIARRVMNPKKHEYRIKKEAIQTSIYGVDIDPGAVEIAKLRLWLSLVVDYELEDIEPLPNLDYKIMCGNSLLGIEKNLFNEYLLSDLEKTKALLFDETGKKPKEILKKQIDALLKQIVFQHKEFDFNIYFSEVFHKRGGFDVIVFNPPYIGEKGNESIFHEVVRTDFGKQFYTRWMDYFYFFIHKALDLARDNSAISFITTNYFFTATGAKKLRLHLSEASTITKLVNFNELKIFDSARGQHNAITILRKGRDLDAIAQNATTLRNGSATPQKLVAVLSWTDTETLYINVKQRDLYEGGDKQIRLRGHGSASADPIESILEKVSANNLLLGQICHVLSGVVTLADKVSAGHLRDCPETKGKKGDGILVLDQHELKQLDLGKVEIEKFVRPFFKNSDIQKYACRIKNTLWLLRMKDEGSPIVLSKNLKAHFERFKGLLLKSKENLLKNKIAASFIKRWLANGNYFVMLNPKEDWYFTGPKIIAPYRSKANTFAYNELPWYASKDVSFILRKRDDLNLKYVLGLLNSRLYYVWLYHKGKRKGNTLELYIRPLSEIPIKRISPSDQQPFIKLVDRILAAKARDMTADVRGLERDMDRMVYVLYGLTEDEIAIVESVSK